MTWHNVVSDPPTQQCEVEYMYEGGKPFPAYFDGWQFRAEKPKTMGSLWQSRPLIVDATDSWRALKCLPHA